MSESEQKNIVVLGASYVGVSTAHNILKHSIPALPDPKSYKLVLISSSAEAMSRPACPRALLSDDLLPQKKLFASIPECFSEYPKENFRFEKGLALNVDHEKRTVTFRSRVGEETISFHALVIATGSSTPSPLFGFNSDEAFLRDQWRIFREGMKNARHIVISGGGPTGVEVAGEIGEYLNGAPRWFGKNDPKVNITLVTAGKQILPLLREKIALKGESYLAAVGVKVIKSQRVVTVSPSEAGKEGALVEKSTITLADGSELEADLFIPATGTIANTGFLDKSLLAEDGRVKTNSSTLRVDKAGPRIYAFGDASDYARPAVHQIMAAVPIAAANIKRDLLLAAGKEASVKPDREFTEDKRETQMVPIGMSKGVGAAMGWQLPRFLVWLIKGRDYWLWTTGDLWNGKMWAKEA